MIVGVNYIIVHLLMLVSFSLYEHKFDDFSTAKLTQALENNYETYPSAIRYETKYMKKRQIQHFL